ncbi:MAG: transketolase [Bacteriovorax sp. MedPE-SWde]|nr:MAG: transketolase [Bacteriovorax sp. MedPE-SWde]
MSTKLNPLKIKNKLANNPTGAPKFAVEVKNNKGESIQVGDPRITRGLLALMNQHATIGGAACHWGGPAAFSEMMSSLHGLMFTKEGQWFDNYNFVNDAGHAENGIYALRANLGFDNLNFEALRKFRSIDSKLTGHGEAHLNPEGVFISNGPLGSGLPQAQGLAIADKLIGHDRVTLCVISDGGCMEGEAKESINAIPGLAKKDKLNPFVMIISDNNTKLGGRISEDSYEMSSSFDSLATLGWDLVKEDNGHDLQKVFTTLESAIEAAKKNPAKPVAVVIKTIKGYGVKSTEESASGGHGYPLKAYDPKLVEFVQEIFEGNAPKELTDWAEEILSQKPEAAKKDPNAVAKEKVQPGLANATIRATEEGLPVFSVSADLQGSTGIKAFHAKYPERFIDIGIAESNMVSTAVGLAKQGLIPIVDTFAQFGVTKGNLPLIMSQLSQGPVIALFSHTGFQDAADGASHQSTTYFSAVSGIPNTTVISLSCKNEADAYMYETIKRYQAAAESGKTPETTIFFFGRESHPVSYDESLTYEWGKAQVLKSGTDGLVVTSGPLVDQALKAHDILKEQGKNLAVINNPFINQIDIKTIGEELKKSGNKLITLEDHQVVGGAGAMLVHALKLAGYEFEVVSLGNKGEFGQSAYKAIELYANHGMDAQAVINSL